MASRPSLLCVPNVSEGRRPEVVHAICGAALTAGAHVLDVHSDPDHHRSVITLAGAGRPVVDAAVALAGAAVGAIDLRSHAGAHPRIGAVDVVPFVPAPGAAMEEAVGAARECARRLWEEMGVPCFLYGEADPARRPLPEVRRGAFGALPPDVGGPGPHPTAGAAAVGAREALVAFNVNLDTDDVAVARRIAHAVRERDGGLPGVRALGLLLAGRGVAQVSMNLMQPAETTMAAAVDAVAAAAAAEGVAVAGAELVGLAPRAALGGRNAAGLLLHEPPKVLEDALRQLAGDP